jgi:hypothetical protein
MQIIRKKRCHEKSNFGKTLSFKRRQKALRFKECPFIDSLVLCKNLFEMLYFPRILLGQGRFVNLFQINDWVLDNTLKNKITQLFKVHQRHGTG